MQQFYGREDILSDLSSLWKKRVSSLLFIGCRVASYTARDAKEIAKLRAMVP